MILTENEALTKFCCMARNSPESVPRGCIASECMAWRYVRAPRLEFSRSLNYQRVRKLVGADIETAEDMLNALKHPAVLSVLTDVTSDCVCIDGPDYDPEDGVLYARFSRADDPQATGYCGLASLNPISLGQQI